MKQWLVILLVPTLLGLTMLLWLDGRKVVIGAELTELKQSPPRSAQPERGRDRSVIPRSRISEGEADRKKTTLEEVVELSRLEREELKSLAVGILALEKGEEFDTQNKNSNAIIASIAELEPDWVLREIGKREVGKKYHWYSQRLSGVAFEIYLERDSEKALAWFDQGAGVRSSEFFLNRVLDRLAVSEYLKRDPMRAVEILRSDAESEKRIVLDRKLPGTVRFENLDQISDCVKVLPLVEEGVEKNWMEKLVASETYRLGGVEGLRGLMDSGTLAQSGSFQILGEIENDFGSENGMKDLLELTRDAPEAVRDELVGSAVGSWGYEDSDAARRYIDGMPAGRGRELALERIIRDKVEYDLDGGYELLKQVEDEATLMELREKLDEETEKINEKWRKMAQPKE